MVSFVDKQVSISDFINPTKQWNTKYSYKHFTGTSYQKNQSNSYPKNKYD